jgi:hypothetical protein
VAAVQYTLTPGGSSTVHIDTRWQQYSTHWHPVAAVQYTFTHKQYTEQNKEQLSLEGFMWFEARVVKIKLRWNKRVKIIIYLGRARVVPRLCELQRGICLTTEEKEGKTLSQDSWRVPVGTKSAIRRRRCMTVPKRKQNVWEINKYILNDIKSTSRSQKPANTTLLLTDDTLSTS